MRTLTCSSGGAPVDLEHESACSYCHAPIAFLDAHQVERVLDELRRDDAAREQKAAELPVRLAADRPQVDRVFTEPGEPDWARVRDSLGVLERDLAAVAALVGRRA